MSLHSAQLIVLMIVAYAGIGVAFALAFVLRGVRRVDPDARGAPIGFRLLILPGAAALWPLLLRRWRAAAQRCSEEATP